jgi:hypothetical protein
VDSDVPGATVFLDRKFLGTTPVETRAFEPGTHRLNVSAEGYEMYAKSVDLAAGPNKVTVRFKEVRLDERVAVAHKHGVGACHGVLHASTAGLRFEADKPGDSFEAPFGVLEPLQVDYLAKNLRVKQKGGRTIAPPEESPLRTRSQGPTQQTPVIQHHWDWRAWGAYSLFLAL